MLLHHHKAAPVGQSAAPGEPIIEVTGLRAQFGPDVILDQVSFTVPAGEIMVIVGGSGCGKSTLLKQMIGLYTPAQGAVKIAGVDVHQADSRALAWLRGQIGVLFQSGALLGSLTLAQNLLLPLEGRAHLSRQMREKLIRMKLGLVNLAGYENHMPSELSGGMIKRAGLARAMVLDPQVLFFDEPGAGLDPITSAELDELILRLNRALGTTMVIVTHELASIFAIAQRVVMLDKSAKGIIAMGTPAELRDQSTDSRVRDFFHRRAHPAAAAETSADPAPRVGGGEPNLRPAG
ncbi:MAG: ATP-binding cassette domain-containing protein [Deltaproteobacteria bacterium]|nr:ATP-binding cassette domain-containing protein [Deltaproteobacteria bacterium]